MGHFKLKNKVKIAEIDENTILEESDYATLTPDGVFVQLEYIDEEEKKPDPTIIKPGIFTIGKSMSGLHLSHTEYNSDALMEDFIHTKSIEDRIDTFFNKVDVYHRYGFEIAKRGLLLYGPPGSGKSASLNKLSRKYATDGQTFILIWGTDKIDAGSVKEFIKSFEYKTNNIKRMILIAEDIGGIEADEVKIRSESSLLSLLDNQEKSFSIDTCIIGTTNYPESFMGNLTNRPNRFDDKIKVGFPPAEAREALLKFFDKDSLCVEDDFKKIKSKKCEEFTPAHLREIIVRSAIYDKKVSDTIDEMLGEIANYKNSFQGPKRNLGFGMAED